MWRRKQPWRGRGSGRREWRKPEKGKSERRTSSCTEWRRQERRLQAMKTEETGM